MNEESLGITGKPRRRHEETSKQAKRVKREAEGVVWGEESTKSDRDKRSFLDEKSSQVAGSVQSRIKVYTGVEWMIRDLLKECSHRAVELVDLTEGVENWEI